MMGTKNARYKARLKMEHSQQSKRRRTDNISDENAKSYRKREKL
jgi:hypothetical protein